MTKKQKLKLWEHFRKRIQDGIWELGAVFVPAPGSSYQWSLVTQYGVLQLKLHAPRDSDPTFALFARFVGDGPYPSDADQYSGKWNFYPSFPNSRISKDEVDRFADYVLARLESVAGPVTKNNPAPGRDKFTLRVERTGYGDMVTASNGGKVFYGGDPNRERDLQALKAQVLTYYPNATFAWAKAVRLDPEVQADLDTDDRRRNPLRVPIRVGTEVMGLQGTDGGYVGRVKSSRVDSRGKRLVTYVDSDGKERETYAFNLTENVPAKGVFPRLNPHIDPVLLTKGGILRLAETVNELESFRSRGWQEAPSKLHTKLDRLRVLDANGWATLVDGEFEVSDLDSALAMLGSGRRPASTQSSYDRLPV